MPGLEILVRHLELNRNVWEDPTLQYRGPSVEQHRVRQPQGLRPGHDPLQQRRDGHRAEQANPPWRWPSQLPKLLPQRRCPKTVPFKAACAEGTRRSKPNSFSPRRRQSSAAEISCIAPEDMYVSVKDFNFDSFTFFKQKPIKAADPHAGRVILSWLFCCEHQVPLRHSPRLYTLHKISEVGLPKGKYFCWKFWSKTAQSYLWKPNPDGRRKFIFATEELFFFNNLR